MVLAGIIGAIGLIVAGVISIVWWIANFGI